MVLYGFLGLLLVKDTCVGQEGYGEIAARRMKSHGWTLVQSSFNLVSLVLQVYVCAFFCDNRGKMWFLTTVPENNHNGGSVQDASLKTKGV